MSAAKTLTIYEQMDKQKFYHLVVEPCMLFIKRSAEDLAAHPNYNEVISSAVGAATSAYHCHEVASRQTKNAEVPPMTDGRAEDLRLRLKDVVDTSKHGILRDPRRIVSLRSALAFEFNQENQFRFLRTEVLACNEIFGEFEVGDTLVEFIDALGKEHDVQGLDVKITFPKRRFVGRAEVRAPESPLFSTDKLHLRMYRRNDAGELVLHDTPFEFAILGAQYAP